TRPTHIVQFRPIGLEDAPLESAPFFDNRHRTPGRKNDVWFGQSEYRNGAARRVPFSICSVRRLMAPCACDRVCVTKPDCKDGMDRLVAPGVPPSNPTT